MKTLVDHRESFDQADIFIQRPTLPGVGVEFRRVAELVVALGQVRKRQPCSRGLRRIAGIQHMVL